MRAVLPVILLIALAGCGGAADSDPQAQRLAEIEEDIAGAQELEQALPAAEAQVEELEDGVAELEGLFVRNEAEGMARLERELLACGLRDHQLQLLGTSVENGVASLRIRVVATTPQALAADALDLLTRRPLLIVMEELTLRREDEATTRVLFTARLGLVADEP